MANAFGVNDPRVSKGLPSYLRTLANSETEKGLFSASPAIKGAIKHADKKGMDGSFKSARKVGRKHPEGVYMLSRIASHLEGREAAKLGASPRHIKDGRKFKAVADEMADKRLSKGVTTGLKMVENAGQGMKRTAVTGGTKKTSDLARRLAGKKPKPFPGMDKSE